MRQRCRSTEKLATGAKGDTPEGQLRCGGQVPSSCAQKTVKVFFEEFQSPSAFRFKSRSGLSPASAARPLTLRKHRLSRAEAEGNHTEEEPYFTAASAGLDFSAPRTTPRPGKSPSAASPKALKFCGANGHLVRQRRAVVLEYSFRARARARQTTENCQTRT